jgi:enediyne biosynthesis protein E4
MSPSSNSDGCSYPSQSSFSAGEKKELARSGLTHSKSDFGSVASIPVQISNYLPIRYVKTLVVWAAVVLIWWHGRLPKLAPDEASDMAGRFHFQRTALVPFRPPIRTQRDVNPKLAGIVSWISSTGAAVALGDLDGDGLANDICLVDPRTDDVILSPAPGSGERYPAFTLRPEDSMYDSSTMAPMGCLLVDLNEDGLLDVVVYYWGRTPVAFLRRGDSPHLSSASFVSQELVPGGERWYTNAGLAADIDGDGHLDLVFGNYFPDGSVVLGRAGPVKMQASMSRARNGGSKAILLWKSAATGQRPAVDYQRVKGLESQLGTGWTLAMAACDLDGDLRPELYIANDFGPDVLLHNQSAPGHVAFEVLRGRRGWTTPKSKVIGQDSFKGMGVDCGDLNGDGIPDLMVGNITDSYALEESNLVYISTGDAPAIRNGIAPYREAGEALGLAHSGWSWDVRFGDFDNGGTPEIVQAAGFVRGTVDRWPELHELAMGNDLMLSNPAHWPRFVTGDDLSGTRDHDHFFVRDHSGRYYDLSSEIGLADPQLSRGIAVGDVDGDGRLDFVVANQWGDSYLFRNVSPSPGAFLALHVYRSPFSGETMISDGHPLGHVRVSPAIGARITVFLPDGRKLVKEVDGGNGHSGKSSPDIHFGLGKVDQQALHVAVDWRDWHGTVRHDEAYLRPGWHTVQLASQENDH